MNAKYALGRYNDSVESLERLRMELEDLRAQYVGIDSCSYAIDGMPHGGGISNTPLAIAERRAFIAREIGRVRRNIEFHERIRCAVEDFLASLDILEEKVIRYRFLGPRRTWNEIADLMYVSRRTVIRLSNSALSRWKA